MVGIPYGRRYTATVKASRPKEVKCENCDCAYIYTVEREASGEGSSFLWLDNQGAKDRANDAALASLEKKLLQAIEPVACPDCGWFQGEMCKILKKRRLIIGASLTFITAGILSFLGYINDDQRMLQMAVYTIPTGIFLSVIWYVAHKPNRVHPGQGGKNPERASASKATTKAAVEAEIAEAQAGWEENFYSYLLQSMAHMASVDGSTAQAEIEAVSAVYNRLTGEEQPVSVILKRLQDIEVPRAEFIERLALLSSEMTQEAKDLFIRAGVIIATADGGFEESEWEFLAEICQTLEIPEERFGAVLESFEENREEGK